MTTSLSYADQPAVYSFEHYGRDKLESQVEELEEEWQDERILRIELQKLLKIEQRAHSDLQFELRETKIQLEKEIKAQRELLRQWEDMKKIYETAIEDDKKTKRDKKELKQRLVHSQTEIEKLELELKKAKEDHKNLNRHIDEMRQEKLIEEERETGFKDREIIRSNDKIKDLEKKMEEVKRGFEIERSRFQHRQTEMINDMKRVQLEREKALQDLDLAVERIEKKNKQLTEAFDEIDLLESEAKKMDDELQSMHDKILICEQEKRQLKRELEENKKESSERLTKETSDYVNRLNDLRTKNQNLTEKLDAIQLDRERWQAGVHQEYRLKLEDIQIDMNSLRDENRSLNAQLKELRREELKGIPRAEMETMQMRQEIDSLKLLVDKLKNQIEAERKQFIIELEEEQARNMKLHREIDQLKKEINSIKADAREEKLELERKQSKIEEKNKRLTAEMAQYKRENERLLGDMQQLKGLNESDLRRKLETIASLEGELKESEQKRDKLEEKFKNTTYDLKHSNSELKRLTESFEALKKEKQRLDEVEKQDLSLLAEIKRKETQLLGHIETLEKSLSEWKERAKLTESSLSSTTSQLSRATDTIRLSSLNEDRLGLELTNAKSKIRELTEKIDTRDKSIIEMSDKFTIDMKKLNQQISEQQSTINRLKNARDRQHKEEIDQLKSVEDARRREIEIENNRVISRFQLQLDEKDIFITQLFKKITDNEGMIKRREDEIDILRKQLYSASDRDGGFEQLQELYEQLKKEFKTTKDQLYDVTSERDNLNFEKIRLSKQIEILDANLANASSSLEDNVKAQLNTQNVERSLKAEISARDQKIQNLNQQVSGLKSELERLSNENLTLESEKAAFGFQIEQAKGQNESNTLNLTISRLRQELSVKDEQLSQLTEESIKNKMEIENLLGKHESELASRNSEILALKKSKEILEKDHKDLSAILHEKVLVQPSGSDSSLLQNQILRLSEQITHMSIEQSDLQDQISTLQNQKYHLQQELATHKNKVIKSKKIKEKKKREKEGSQIRRELYRLAANKSLTQTSRKIITDDQSINAAVTIQSACRGKLARMQLHQSKRRYQIAKEIVTSESSYVSHLRVLVECYIEPLKKLHYLNDEEITILFGNVEDILKNNSSFLENIEERLESWHVSQSIGDIFVQHIDSFKPHSKYTQHFATNLDSKERVLSGKVKSEVSKENLDNFFRIVQMMPNSEGKTLKDLLIMPVQRIPRYKLLLEDLVRHTSKSHSDYQMLSLAVDLISKLAEYINENNRRVETLLAMSEVTVTGLEVLPPNSDRGLILKSNVTAVFGGDGKAGNYTVHIFTDCLVFTKESKRHFSLKLAAHQDKLCHHVMFSSDLNVDQYDKHVVAGVEYSNVIRINEDYIIFSGEPKMFEFYNQLQIAFQKQ